MFSLGFHRWCYFHAHWYYKWASGYAYELNCQCEELTTKIDQLIAKSKEQQAINKAIKQKSYISPVIDKEAKHE